MYTNLPKAVMHTSAQQDYLNGLNSNASNDSMGSRHVRAGKAVFLLVLAFWLFALPRTGQCEVGRVKKVAESGLNFRLVKNGEGASPPVERVDEGIDAMSAYRHGNYQLAIPLLRQAIVGRPKDSELTAALVASLVHERLIDEASAEAEKAGAAFPDSAEVLGAQGDLAFYLGDMGAAERFYKLSLKQKETARSLIGLCRLYRSASMFRTSRMVLFRAHQVGPEDAAVQEAWAEIISADKKSTLAASNPLASVVKADSVAVDQLQKRLEGHRPNQLTDPPSVANIPLEVMQSVGVVNGCVLRATFNGKIPLRLFVSTTQTGISIENTTAILRLQQSMDPEDWVRLNRGIDGKPLAPSFWTNSGAAAMRIPHYPGVFAANTCEIGNITLRYCVAPAIGNEAFSHNTVTGRVSSAVDGYIGLNMFSEFLVTLDFHGGMLHLQRQAERPVDTQGYDREVSPETASYLRLFRFGNTFMLPVAVNGLSPRLFLLSTATNVSQLDEKFATEILKIRKTDIAMTKAGMKVKDVFQVENVDLQFGKFEQKNKRMPVVDLTGTGTNEIRVAGVLGLPVLSLFRITLDYQNGLAKFEPNYDEANTTVAKPR